MDSTMLQIQLSLDQLRDLLSDAPAPSLAPKPMEPVPPVAPHTPNVLESEENQAPPINPAVDLPRSDYQALPLQILSLGGDLRERLTQSVIVHTMRYYVPVRQFILDTLEEINGKQGAIDDMGSWMTTDSSNYFVLSYTPGQCEILVNNKSIGQADSYETLAGALRYLVSSLPNKFLQITPELYEQLIPILIKKHHLPSAKYVQKIIYSLPPNTVDSRVFQSCLESSREIKDAEEIDTKYYQAAGPFGFEKIRFADQVTSALAIPAVLEIGELTYPVTVDDLAHDQLDFTIENFKEPFHSLSGTARLIMALPGTGKNTNIKIEILHKRKSGDNGVQITVTLEKPPPELKTFIEQMPTPGLPMPTPEPEAKEPEKKSEEK